MEYIRFRDVGQRGVKMDKPLMFNANDVLIKPPFRVLTIAGSDSGGSAGIQADLKTFEARQVFGMTALTMVTAQNTLGVKAAMALPLDLIAEQIDAVLSDSGAHAIKTGLLGRAEVIHLVAERLDTYQREQWSVPLVVDPVLVDGQGRRIVSEETMMAYRTVLFPMATVITPNLDEACWLADMETIQEITDFEEAARRLYAYGVRGVFIKGGHLGREIVTDVFYDGEGWDYLTAPMLPIENPHGVGCTFASAIAAEIAKGKPATQAVQVAHGYVQRALQGALAWQVGRGRKPVNHQAGRD